MRSFGTTSLLAGCALALAACGTPNSPELDQARTAVSAARANPDVMSYAQTELASAENALSQGDQALKDDDLQRANTQAYLASRRAATAQEYASARAGNQAIQGSGEARERAIRMTLEQRLAELQATKTDRGLVVGLQGDVLFAVDQSVLTSGGRREVDRVAAALRDFPQAKAIIEGHTDSTGTDAYNLALSERRANAVRAELMAAGIASSRLVAHGMGEAYPKAPNDTAAGRQQNRRVEVIVQEGTAGG